MEPEEGDVIVVDQFTPALFDCSAAGIPPPTISWVRVHQNGTIEELNGGRYMLFDSAQDDLYDLENTGTVSQVNHTLTLSNISDNDSGTYRCIASNKAGSYSQDFALVVQGILKKKRSVY